MENFALKIEELYIDEVNYILATLELELNETLVVETSLPKIAIDKINYFEIKNLLIEIGKSNPNYQSKMEKAIMNYQENSSSREVLADLGMGTTTVLVVAIIALAWMQMGADEKRVLHPDELIKPDGTTEKRNYYSTVKVLERLKEIIKVTTPTFWEHVKEILENWSNGSQEVNNENE